MQEKEKPISQKIQTTPQGGLHNTAESPLGVTPDVAGPPTIIGMHHGPSGYWEAIGAWHAHNRTFNPPDVTTFRMRGFDKAKMRAAGKSYRRGYMEELEREARRQIRRGTVVKASVQRKKRRAELWAALKAAGC